MANLSVNINKIAVLRNSRGEDNPNLLSMAKLIENLGANGITVHPRPDERHIKKSDVILLKKNIVVEFNVEGYPSPDFIDFMYEIKPDQITLVPDPPHVLTSNAGFKLREDLAHVKQVISKLKNTGSRISIFVDPKDFIDRDIAVIKSSGADRIELYTKSFAENYQDQSTINLYKDLAMRAKKIGLGVNAGHDLSLQNLGVFLQNIKAIDEVSIGHALICDALILGLPETMTRYLQSCRLT